MASDAELNAQRKVTRAFIRASATLVTLTPHTRERGPRGAWTEVAGTDRDPQLVRLVPQPGTSVLTDETGTRRSVDYQLLGEWDAEVEVGDRYTDLAGNVLTVVALEPDNGYEVRAQVTVSLRAPAVVAAP